MFPRIKEIVCNTEMYSLHQTIKRFADSLYLIEKTGGFCD